MKSLAMHAIVVLALCANSVVFAGMDYSETLYYSGKPFPVANDIILRNAKRSIEAKAKNSDSKLSKAQVRQIATDCKLFEETRFNPQLRYTEDDISFWWKEGLSGRLYKMQFCSIRAILEAADKNETIISSQGDLTAMSKEVMASMLRAQKDLSK